MASRSNCYTGGRGSIPRTNIGVMSMIICYVSECNLCTYLKIYKYMFIGFLVLINFNESLLSFRRGGVVGKFSSIVLWSINILLYILFENQDISKYIALHGVE